MAVITAVTPQKRRGYYNIFLDGKFAFGVSEDTLVRFRLIKGAELDDVQTAHVQAEDALSRATSVVVTYLSHQSRTAKEVHDRLVDEEIPEGAIATVVARLQERGYINDANYAQYFVDDNVTMGDRGPRQLTAKLRQKGISADLVDNAVAEYTPEQRLAVGTRVAQRVVRHGTRKSHVALVRSLKTTLMQKGFDGDDIDRIIATAAPERDEEQENDLLLTTARKVWRQKHRYTGRERRMKVKQALVRKGFGYDLIDNILDDIEAEDDDE